MVVIREAAKRVMLGRYEIVKHLAQAKMADVLPPERRGSRV
jgi:hypothetical protein